MGELKKAHSSRRGPDVGQVGKGSPDIDASVGERGGHTWAQAEPHGLE